MVKKKLRQAKKLIRQIQNEGFSDKNSKDNKTIRKQRIKEQKKLILNPKLPWNVCVACTRGLVRGIPKKTDIISSCFKQCWGWHEERILWKPDDLKEPSRLAKDYVRNLKLNMKTVEEDMTWNYRKGYRISNCTQVWAHVNPVFINLQAKNSTKFFLTTYN